MINKEMGILIFSKILKREYTKMRNVIFNSAIMPVFILMDDKNIGKLKNGKEFVYLIDEEEHSFNVVWVVSTDPKNTYSYSPPLLIGNSKDDIKIRIKNSYSFKNGSIFELIVID